MAASCFCGVQAIGRCGGCGRAFCLSHQAIDPPSWYADLCMECLEKRNAQRQIAIADREARERSRQGSLLTRRKHLLHALRAAGLPGSERLIHKTWRRTWYGRAITIDTPYGEPGYWIPGVIAWGSRPQPRSESEWLAMTVFVTVHGNFPVNRLRDERSAETSRAIITALERICERHGVAV